MRALTLAFAFLFICCAAPALAQNEDLFIGNARWGMTKAEVLALGDKKPDLVEENALTYKTTLMDNAFLVVYTFDKDGKLFQLAYATIDKNRQKAYGPMKKYLEDMKYKDVMTPEHRRMGPEGMCLYESDNSRISFGFDKKKKC